jgi:hypothetical protein
MINKKNQFLLLLEYIINYAHSFLGRGNSLTTLIRRKHESN